eukprot:264936-Chlamydomonas_euryale.AAC.2
MATSLRPASVPFFPSMLVSAPSIQHRLSTLRSTPSAWRHHHGRPPASASAFTHLLGIAQDHDDGVSAQKHLGDEAVFVDRPRALGAFARLWHLHGPLRHVRSGGRGPGRGVLGG